MIGYSAQDRGGPGASGHREKAQGISASQGASQSCIMVERLGEEPGEPEGHPQGPHQWDSMLPQIYHQASLVLSLDMHCVMKRGDKGTPFITREPRRNLQAGPDPTEWTPSRNCRRATDAPAGAIQRSATATPAWNVTTRLSLPITRVEGGWKRTRVTMLPALTAPPACIHIQQPSKRKSEISEEPGGKEAESRSADRLIMNPEVRRVSGNSSHDVR